MPRRLGGIEQQVLLEGKAAASRKERMAYPMTSASTPVDCLADVMSCTPLGLARAAACIRLRLGLKLNEI